MLSGWGDEFMTSYWSMAAANRVCSSELFCNIMFFLTTKGAVIGERCDNECECGLSFGMLCELCCVVSCYRWRSLLYIYAYFHCVISTGRLAQLVARQIPNLKVRSSILLLVTPFCSPFQVLSPFVVEQFLFTSVITHCHSTDSQGILQCCTLASWSILCPLLVTIAKY